MKKVPTLVLRPLTAEDCETARRWRNDPRIRPSLRTLDMLTAEQQREFYQRVVCDWTSSHRYWVAEESWTGGGEDDDEVGSTLVGLVGLTDIRYANGSAEISLLINPDLANQGLGRAVVQLVLAEAFDRMRLLTVYGECYECNPAIGFWKTITLAYGGSMRSLPRRKWWDGRLWDALYFSISAEDWRAGNGR